MTEQEFLKLVESLKPRLCAQAHKFLSRYDVSDLTAIEEVVEDTVQAVWQRLFRGGPHTLTLDTLPAYLNTAVMSKCMNYVNSLPIEASLEDFASDDSDEIEWLEYHSAHEAIDTSLPHPPFVPAYDVTMDVQRALAVIPPWAADLLIRYHVEGMTQEEIALEAGLNRRTLSDRLVRAESLLREQLEGYGEDERG